MESAQAYVMKGAFCAISTSGFQAQLLISSSSLTVGLESNVDKPADSSVFVGRGARFCGFCEISGMVLNERHQV